MEELRKPESEEEADILHGAIRALANVRGDFVNFIPPPRLAATLLTDDPPDFNAPSTHYTVRREPVGWWRLESGEGVAILQVKRGKDVVMNICPNLARIVSSPPTAAPE